MYIDLIRAYLVEYGSQERRARVLGVTEAYLSFVLTSPTSVGRGRWDRGLWLPEGHLAQEPRLLKTPSELRASTIAEVLCTDRERRDVLRYHLAAAREISMLSTLGKPDVALDQDDISQIVRELGRTHAVALHDVEPDETREAYARVWEMGTATVSRIDPNRCALDLVQVLLFVHDAASVLDRQDLGLGYARMAQLVLTDVRRSAADDLVDRYWLNVLLAEAVSLKQPRSVAARPDRGAIRRNRPRWPSNRAGPMATQLL